jgi:ATP-dependent DNA ligase
MTTPVVYFAFDVLRLNGRDLMQKPLKERREVLQTRVVPRLPKEIRYSESFRVTADEMIAAVKAQGLEGVIAKRLDTRYEPGERSGAWVKLRVGQSGEFVIGGFIPAGSNFDALIVGAYQGDKLMYAGKVRSGFVPATRRSVFERLRPLVRPTCPFANLPDSRKGRWGEGLTAEDMAKCVWVEPQLTAIFDYAELTPAKRLRHPKFIALR